MRRKARSIVAQSSQINDLTHPGVSSNPGEVLRGHAVGCFKIPLGIHGMNQVVGRIHALQREAQGGLIKDITGKYLCRRPDSRGEKFGTASQAADDIALAFQAGQESSADIPGGAGQ
jgi:hypothetical protein